MATNGTCSSTELLEAVEQYAASLQPAYLDLMTNTVFASFSLPFLISLFYFSDGSRRRTAMFVLVVLSVALALIQYVYQAGLRLASLYHPAQATGALTPAILTSLLILRDLPNFVADLALSARLLAVYPPRTTPRAVLARVLGPAVAVKFARAASMAVIWAYDGQIVPGAGLFVYWSEWERAWLIANRALTVVDNAYPTAFFLWKLKPAFHWSGAGRDSGHVSMGGEDTFSRRIRIIFLIAMTNCLVPVPLYVAQLAQVIATPNSTAFAYFQEYVVLSSVVCVAFATIWASASRRDTPQFRGEQPEQPEEVGLPVWKKQREYPLQVHVELSREMR